MPRSIRLIMIAIGLALVAASAGYYGWASWRAAAMGGWPQASGRIISSTISSSGQGRSMRDGNSSPTYHPRVIYTYAVNGHGYRGDRVWLTGYTGSYDIAEAAAVSDAYPPGSAVVVRYNPADPNDAALRIAWPRWEILFITAMGLAWIAFGTLFARGRPVAELSRRDRERRARVTMLLTLASFVAIAGSILYLMFFF